jgi:hypothetical protein
MNRNNFKPNEVLKKMEKDTYDFKETKRLLEECCHALVRERIEKDELRKRIHLLCEGLD